MIKKEQLKYLIEAQDIVRQVWINQNTPEESKIVRLLDKHITQVINQIGAK
jgi:hypothetical protein